MGNNQYYTYILTNRRHTVLYIGCTSELAIRTWKHKTGYYDGFTKRYNVNKLIYFEEHSSAYEAITREKQLKGWTRKKKETLINELNPDWKDLYSKIN